MQRVLAGFICILGIFLAGCGSPKFAYLAPAANLNRLGPSISVMPLTDSRTNRDMDSVLAKGYLVDVQKAIGGELQSMDFFSSVVVITNATTVPVTDLKLSPTLRQLEWEIPHYGALEVKAFAVGFLTGIVGSAIYASTGIDVYGHSSVAIRVDQMTTAPATFNFEYSDTVTNRLKKAVCDTPPTKASLMIQAFQKSLGSLKTDLQKNLPPPAGISTATNTPSANK